jgi:threonine dehydrogenase-like Zn-dependent dehydrogenase
MGADGVGRIAKVKGDSSKHKVGDRVVVMPSVGWDKDPRGPEGSWYILGGGPAPGKDFVFICLSLVGSKTRRIKEKN